MSKSPMSGTAIGMALVGFFLATSLVCAIVKAAYPPFNAKLYGNVFTGACLLLAQIKLLKLRKGRLAFVSILAFGAVELIAAAVVALVTSEESLIGRVTSNALSTLGYYPTGADGELSVVVLFWGASLLLLAAIPTALAAATLVATRADWP